MKRFSNNQRFVWLAVFLAAMMLFASVSVQAAQRIRVPYAAVAPSAGWWCGLAITNLSSLDIEDLYLDVCTPGGRYGSLFSNYRTNIGPLEGFNMLVDSLEGLYGTLPSEQVWFELWHEGSQKFAVSVFSGQTLSGTPLTLSVQSFFSEAAANTFPDVVPPIITLEKP